MASEGKNLVGVDIGSTSIKVCELRETRRGLSLVRFGFHPLPEDAIVDGQIVGASAIVDGLDRLFHKHRHRHVALRASGHGVIIKKISMPILKPEELREQIGWESEQHIPFDRGEVQIDHQILGIRDREGQMDVLLVAAKLEEINDLTSIAREAGLKPVVIDLDAFTVQNVFERSVGVLPMNETIVLIHTGASLTTVNIVSRGITAFTRDIAIAGDAITEDIQRRLGIGRQEAEDYKCGGEGYGGVPPEVPRIIDETVDRLAAEIQRSLDFYLATSGDDVIHRVYFSGGTANLNSLVEAVAARQQVQVERLDPLLIAKPDPKLVDPTALMGRGLQAVVSVGLALRKEKERR
jgi:type IV pilus assembly protein PilM